MKRCVITLWQQYVSKRFQETSDKDRYIFHSKLIRHVLHIDKIARFRMIYEISASNSPVGRGTATGR